MQPNIISDVEGIIETALSFERAIRQLLLSASYDSQLPSSSSSTTGTSKPTSPNQNPSRNPLIDLIRGNSTDSVLNQSEMDVRSFSKFNSNDLFIHLFKISPGKENRERLDDNTQMQSKCARYIHLFIGNNIYSIDLNMNIPFD